MEPHDSQRGRGRRRKHRHAADENHPRQPLRARHPPDPHHRRERAAGQVMRHGEDRGERAVRGVRLAVNTHLAEEHRLRADDLAVDDDGLMDFCRLRHGQIAGCRPGARSGSKPRTHPECGTHSLTRSARTAHERR